ncbi:MAG: rod shape-determining protein MreC [Acidobacteriota bacterium]
MLEFLSNRRSGVALFTIVTLLLSLLSYQKRHPERVTVVERGVFEALSPVVVATSGVVDRVTEIEKRYRELRDADRHAKDLERQVAQLHEEMGKAREAVAQNDRLKALLALHDVSTDEYVAGQVLSSDPRAPWSSILINRGRRDGVRPSTGVVAPEGVVGKVIGVSEPASKVQLVTDEESGVGGLVQRSRAVGVVVGRGGRGGRSLEMLYINHLDDVRAGDRVVTSGLDGIFPRGTPIGTVTHVKNLADLTKQVEIEPAVSVKNLDYVLVRTEPPDSSPFVALLGQGGADRDGSKDDKGPEEKQE